MKTSQEKSDELKTRKLTVCRLADGQSRRYELPEIRLRGQWLEDAGFEPGQIITIVCSDKQLLIHTDGTRKYATPLKKINRSNKLKIVDF